MNTTQSLARFGSVASFVGAFLLFVSTLLHPSESDPNIPTAAFAEYAANSIWVWSHLGQFAGVIGIGMSLVAIAATFESGRAAAWARIGLIGTAAAIAVAAALQAVDGVALKVIVDRWAIATGDTRAIVFEAAFSVRQIEIGLASLFSILTGFTLFAFGLAILFSARYPIWLGWIGLLNGLGMVMSGSAQASTGFSGLSMILSMSTSVVLLVWIVAVGIFMWRLAPQLAHDKNAA
jgi:hypothetical protein